MKKLLIATTNLGKLREYKEFLYDLPVQLLSLEDAVIIQKAPEDGLTFEENAKSKAIFYSKISGLPTIADDGGFEIDYLGGAPGVKSHRWIHQDREDTDEEIIAYTLKKLNGVPMEKRGAQLKLVLAFANGEKVIGLVEKSIRGTVAFEPSQKSQPGFPYRSIHYFPKLKKYYDELTSEEMDIYNHRKKAVLELKPLIKNYFS